MNARIARGIAWVLVGVYILLAMVGLTLQAVADTPYVSTGIPVEIILIILVGGLMITGALIISRHPQHPVGWLLCIGLFSGAIDMFAAGYTAYDTYVSGSLPGVLFALIWLRWNSFPFGIAFFTLVVLLFPDGHPPSPRWRIVAWAAIGALLLYLPLLALEPGPADPFFLPIRYNPLGVSASLWAFLKPLMWMAFSILVLCYTAALISLISRLRRARGEERQQIKWLLYPAGLFWISIPLLVLGLVQANELIMGIGLALGQPAIAGMVIAIAFAIFKYRLYDIDIIINRTLVYGALTAGVVGVYALVVGGLGVLFQSRGNLIVALVATGLVAVLFQPLRARLQKGVNRMMYGERDEPFTVLRRLGQRLESSGMPEDTLTAIVETVTQALKLPYAEITIRHGERFERAAWYGKHANEMASFPIQYQGQTIGYLKAARRGQGESLAELDEGLLRQIARQAGPVAQSVQLTRDLRQSRARLVTAREEERHRLRRDLHDGLGPVLASQGLKIAAVRHLLDSDPEAARKLLDEMAFQNETTMTEIRRLVYALRPPELDELGLAGAVREYAAGLNGNVGGATRFQVNVQPPDEELAELPAAVEVAAYRIATEALTNVTRYAQARHCTVSLKVEANGSKDVLLLEIADDGVGISNNGKAGIGLNTMRERAEEVRGELQIESRPDQGTRVAASFPLTD